MSISIDQKTARRLILKAQGLDGSWKPGRGVDGAAAVVQRLRYVQIDTIAVVERAHHHTFWSRIPSYEPAVLHDLLTTRRRVFEYWSPQAGYVPMDDFRYYRRHMQGVARRPRTRAFLDANRKLVRHIVKRIREEGPLGSADFAAPSGHKSSGWWNWKPAKRVLDTLYSTGKLMVSERRNFHRIYDLAERVLPAGIDTSLPSPAQQATWRIRRELNSQGLARPAWWWLRGHGPTEETLEGLVASGEVCRVSLNGASGPDMYALADHLQGASKRSRRRPDLWILSPFDSVMSDRQRARMVFDFDYSLESYTPAPRRKYGYFCLPILWGDQFIGRMDAKAERKQGKLIVHAIAFEPGGADLEAAMTPLARKLTAFARFNGCDHLQIKTTTPRKWLLPLRRELRA